MEPIAVWSSYRNESADWHPKGAVSQEAAAVLAQHRVLAEALRTGGFRNGVVIFGANGVTALRTARIEHVARPHAEVELDHLASVDAVATASFLAAVFERWQLADGAGDAGPAVRLVGALLDKRRAVPESGQAAGNCLVGLAGPLAAWARVCGDPTTVVWAAAAEGPELLPRLPTGAVHVQLRSGDAAAPDDDVAKAARLLELAVRPSGEGTRWTEGHAAALRAGLSVTLARAVRSGELDPDPIYRLCKRAVSLNTEPAQRLRALASAHALLEELRPEARGLAGGLWRAASAGSPLRLDLRDGPNGTIRVGLAVGDDGFYALGTFRSVQDLSDGWEAAADEGAELRGDLLGRLKVRAGVGKRALGNVGAISSKSLQKTGVQLWELPEAALLERIGRGDATVMEGVYAHPSRYPPGATLMAVCAEPRVAPEFAKGVTDLAIKYLACVGDDVFNTVSGAVRGWLKLRAADVTLAGSPLTQHLLGVAMAWEDAGKFRCIDLFRQLDKGEGRHIRAAGGAWTEVAGRAVLHASQHDDVPEACLLEIARAMPHGDFLLHLMRRGLTLPDDLAEVVRGLTPVRGGAADTEARELVERQLGLPAQRWEDGALLDRVFGLSPRPAIPAHRPGLARPLVLLDRGVPEDGTAAQLFTDLERASALLHPASEAVHDRLLSLAALLRRRQNCAFYTAISTEMYARHLEAWLERDELESACVVAEQFRRNRPDWRERQSALAARLAFRILVEDDKRVEAFSEQLQWGILDMFRLTGPAPLCLRENPAAAVQATMDRAGNQEDWGPVLDVLPTPDGIPGAMATRDAPGWTGRRPWGG